MAGPLGRSVMLPQNARPDLAFDSTLVVGAITPGLVRLHVTPGAYFEVIAAVVFTLVTSAVVAQRVPRVDIQDADGNVLYSLLANGYQRESQTMRHGFFIDAGQSYFSGATNSVTVLPYVLLQPGHKTFVTWSNVDSNDQMNGSTITLQEIPTGPLRNASAPPVALAPLA